MTTQLTLWEACKTGDIQIVKELLAAGADPNEGEDADISGSYALAAACENGHADIAKLLLDAGAKPYICWRGPSLFQYASESGSVEVVKLLVNKVAEISPGDARDVLTRMYALQKSGSELKPWNAADGRAALFVLACIGGWVSLVDRLLTTNLEIEPELLDKAFIGASAWGNSAVVNFLLNSPLKITVKTVSDASVSASKQGCTDSIRALMAQNIDTVNHALQKAIEEGYADITELLFATYGKQKGFKIPEDALRSACIAGRDLKTIKLLINTGFNINDISKRSTPFMEACMNGNIDLVEMLLKAGADINKTNASGCSALMWACGAGNLKTVELLLASGADVNITDKYGNTALVWACDEGYREIAELLLKAGADPNKKTKTGKTALSQAQADEKQSLVSLLKSYGAKE